MNIDYNNEAVAAFSAQCDEFIGSKLIMSNQKIRMLFKKAPLMSGSRSAFAVATAYRVNNSEASFEGIPALK